MQFHGIGYWYLKNEALNANGFQENLAGIARLADKENEFGFQAGGPVLRDRLFFSAALDHLRSRSTQDAGRFPVPIDQLSRSTPRPAAWRRNC